MDEYVKWELNENASVELLLMRITLMFRTPHTHPGIPGIAEGTGCMRCNAEKALAELEKRASGDERQ